MKELVKDDMQYSQVEKIQSHFHNEWVNFKDAVTSEIDTAKLFLFEKASKSSGKSRHSTSKSSCTG